MNREEAKKFLPLITAFAEGKTIQLKAGDCSWRDITDPCFSVPSACYRIKPEPKVLYINEYPSGRNFGVHHTEASARANFSSDAKRIAVKYVEAID
jgi:hypothetical protein